MTPLDCFLLFTLIGIVGQLLLPGDGETEE